MDTAGKNDRGRTFVLVQCSVCQQDFLLVRTAAAKERCFLQCVLSESSALRVRKRKSGCFAAGDKKHPALFVLSEYRRRGARNAKTAVERFSVAEPSYRINSGGHLIYGKAV